MKVLVQKTDSIDDFNRYSGTKFNDAAAFLNKVANKISDFKTFRFELFYSGYAGFTIYDGDDKIGYLMYDKNVYGLEDCRTGIGWHLKQAYKGKTDDKTWKRWVDTVKALADKDPSKPHRARM